MASNAIYEKNKGQNDWNKQHLGELNDLKFIEDSSLIYTLSSS